MPAGILKRIDDLAREKGLTRSEWVRSYLSSIAIAQDEEFRAEFEKNLEPIKPAFEQFGKALSELAQDPEFMKESILKLINAMLDKMRKEKLIKG